MAKIGTISSVTTGYLSNAQINANFTAIVAAFDNTVSRDGSSPNTVTANIDMNSKQLINLTAPTSNLMAATKKYVDDNNDNAAVVAAAVAAQVAAEAAQAAAELAETNAETAESGAEAAETAALAVTTVVTITSTSNAITVDLDNGAVFKHVFTENTTFTFSNPEATGTRSAFELYLTNDATGRTPTWPASVIWSNGAEPDVTTINEKNILQFTTIDGGTIWYGALVHEAGA